MLVVHRTREDHPLGGHRLELGAGIPEADDHECHIRERGGQAAPRVEQQMDALLAHELPEVEDEAAQPGEPVAGIGVGGPLGRTARIRRRRVSAQHGDQAGKVASARMERVGVDPGRDDVDPVVEALPEQLLGHFDNVARAGEERARPGERVNGQRRELRTAADGVLQLGAVDLDGVGRAAGAGPRRDRDRP